MSQTPIRIEINKMRNLQSSIPFSLQSQPASYLTSSKGSYDGVAPMFKRTRFIL